MKNGWLFIIVVLSLVCFAENPEWINYTNADLVNALIEDGDYIWAGTNGGTGVQWDASSRPSGVYFYKIEMSDFTDVKKCIVIR